MKLRIDFDIPSVNGRMKGTARAFEVDRAGKEVRFLAEHGGEWRNESTKRTFCKAVLDETCPLDGTKKNREKRRGELQKVRRAVLDKLSELHSEAKQKHAGGGGEKSRDATDQYEMTDAGIFWNRPDRDGQAVPVQLTNFSARILADVYRHDGVDESRMVELEAKLHGKVFLGNRARHSVQHDELAHRKNG